MRPGPTRYVTVDEGQVAYQVTGTGPIDVVYMIGHGSAVDLWWDYPPFARVLERIASFGRLILFDRRGSGFSDPMPADRPTSWEDFVDDLSAVLDAAGSERAAIIAAFDAGATAITFAAAKPARTRALVLWNSFARWFADDDYSVGMPLESAAVIRQTMESLWGTKEIATILDPDEANDQTFVDWISRLNRAGSTPATYAKQWHIQASLDVRSVLPMITAPTLVMNRVGYAMIPPDMSRYLAQHIPGARHQEFPGRSANMWGEAGDAIVDAIQEFVTGARSAARVDRVLATVLFTDIVSSTDRAAEVGDARWKELLASHDMTARSVVTEWRGRLIKGTGDGILATFDSPGRAVRAATDLREALRSHGINVRAGLHAGEVELRDEADVGGIAVHIAARVMHEAAPGEVLCTRTVKDLTVGGEISYAERGTRQLKGVPEEWVLFAVSA